MIPVLAPIVGTIMAALTSVVVARIAIATALLAVFAAQMLFVQEYLQDAIVNVSYSAPVWVVTGLSLLPANTPTVIGIMIGAEATLALFRLIKYTLDIKLTGL